MTKLEQIKDKICDHLLSVDLDKLPSYELMSYINAYKTMEYTPPFSGYGLGLGYNALNSCACNYDIKDTSKGE